MARACVSEKLTRETTIFLPIDETEKAICYKKKKKRKKETEEEGLSGRAVGCAIAGLQLPEGLIASETCAAGP